MRNPNSRVLAVLAAACAVVLGQTPPAATDQPADVSGVVTNSVTGEPVVRAHVSLHPTSNRPNSTQQPYGAMTDAEGKFSITSVPPATYFVLAERVGFEAAQTTSRAIKINPGDKKDDFKLQLIPEGAINGRVLDANGDAVEGAQVTADSGMGNGPGYTTDEGVNSG